MLNKNLFSLICLLVLSFSLTAQVEIEYQTESGTPLEDIYIDGIVNRTLVEDGPVIEYEVIREADIVWERKIWRVIDIREKLNDAFKSPKMPFFSIIRELAENGDIAVFKDEFFREPMTVEEVNNELYRVDTTSVFDYDTYEETIQVVANDINWEDIKQFRVKEVWYFDKEVSQLESRILGISPILDKFDEATGEFKYALPIFWIYYPEARVPFAKYRVQNDFNEIAPISWYDLFEQRKFASFIIKESNTLDLRIEDIYYGYDREGIDRLMESDKIKAELFNFEHDLWEY